MRRRTKPATLPIGTVSEGTLRPEDLLDTFLDAAQELRLTRHERAAVRAIAKRWQEFDASAVDTDVVTDDVTELECILSTHVPDYAYFGTLEGDGACFGVWPSFGSLDDDGIDRVADLPIANSHAPLTILQVNDHGNATLYRRAGRRWIEVWSVV